MDSHSNIIVQQVTIDITRGTVTFVLVTQRQVSRNYTTSTNASHISCMNCCNVLSTYWKAISDNQQQNVLPLQRNSAIKFHTSGNTRKCGSIERGPFLISTI